MNYPPPPSYGYAPYPAPDHPQANTILILGILSLFCGVLGPFAWVMGRRTLREIDASYGTIGGRSNVQVGYIFGIVSTVLTAVGLIMTLVWIVALVVFAIGASAS
ncbi:DUF4190 domain-containing protein [Nocardia sp. NPDC052254]|uniref:DUF4190 domain-containing protein n=1 Tax=Nocardia sp. NPDC052254 TaxID=3155681 RepID=UPI0034362F76